MNIRVIAGLGMFLLAGGLMIAWWLGQRTPGTSEPEPVPAETPAAPELALLELPALGEPEAGPAAVDSFLAAYDDRYRTLHAELMEATWAVGTGADASAADLEAARRNLADYTGSRAVIGKLREHREREDLTTLQRRRLDFAWRLAAELPASRPETVARIIATERALADALAGATTLLRLPDAPPRRLDREAVLAHLAGSRDLEARQAAWEAALEAGRALEPLLIELRDLRNAGAREMGYTSYFALQAADQGLTSAELLRLLSGILDAVRPLYAQLHCWARHELAARHGEAAPRRLPVHWLDDPFGARWPGLADVGASPAFADVRPPWIVDQAGGFFIALGFEPLAAGFWERSRLYGNPPPARILHMDLDEDLRALADIQADVPGFRAAHGLLARAYHLRAASTPRVPPLLRAAPDRAFGDAVAALAGIAAGQRPYLEQLGLLGGGAVPDAVAPLLAEALDGPVVAIPYLCGTVAHWEHDLYEADLPAHLANARWWEHAARWQGVVPPYLRGEQHGDPAAAPPVLASPARGWDAALAAVIAHQLHRYACRVILRQDVHGADWRGSPAAGEFLHSLMALGATAGGPEVLRRATGEEISAEALVEYYAPLMAWLERENAGRTVGF